MLDLYSIKKQYCVYFSGYQLLSIEVFQVPLETKAVDRSSNNYNIPWSFDWNCDFQSMQYYRNELVENLKTTKFNEDDVCMICYGEMILLCVYSVKKLMLVTIVWFSCTSITLN